MSDIDYDTLGLAADESVVWLRAEQRFHSADLVDAMAAAIRALRADLSESRRLLDDARAQKPYGYEIDWPLSDGGVDKILTTDADDIEVARANRMEMLPLYAAAPVPAQPAEVPEAVKAAIREYLEASDATRQSQGTWAHPRQWKYNDPEMARLRTARSALGAIISAADTEVQK